MSLSRRSRREWRIVLWFLLVSAVISAYFGFAVAPAGDTPLMGVAQGLLASLLIATPIAIVEVRRARFASLPWLRRLSLAAFFAVKVLFYFVVIINGLILSRWLMSGVDKHPIVFDANFRNSLFFAIGMSLFGSLISETGRLLGFGTLKSLLIGRYVQPQREQKVFLLIDMKNSTGLAERLGPVRFHELLNMFFRDIVEAALDCEAEIHKYVGDEAILTWSVGAGPASPALAEGDCLACPFLARDSIAARGEQYRAQFGVIPEFRAALHCGEIVAGEIGDQRREIAYVGDTLNVAARLLEAAKTTGRDVLVSADLVAMVTLPADLRTEPLPTLAVRGRSAPLEILALERA
jgi:adenylate cyclase